MLGSRFFLCAALIATCFGLADVRADMTLDLTRSGASGYINGAYFVQGNFASAGTGAIDSFVRIQTNQAVERGFNTDARPLQFHENNSANFSRSLLLADAVSYTHLRAHETVLDLVCRLLLEKKKNIHIHSNYNHHHMSHNNNSIPHKHASYV